MKKFFLFFLLVFTSMSVLATEGALAGKFTINANGDQVVFSQGNLQWQSSTQTYRFATNQWDTIGADNLLRSERYNGWIDLLGYGKGSNPYTRPTTYEEMDSTAFDDYGNYPISNGGNEAGLWRTLKVREWSYMFGSRTGASQKKGQATVNGIRGLVLLPDDWTQPARISFTPTPNNWTTNVYSEREWYQMAANGAVFFPATGSFNAYDTTIHNVNIAGYYMALSYNSGGGNGPIMFFEESRIVGACATFLGRMYAVRLAQDVVVPPAPTCPEGRFYSNGAEVTSLTINVGASASVPMLMDATGSIISGSQMSIDDTSVAMITADNLIHGVAAGSAVLTVTSVKTMTDGQVLTCEYTLPITVEASAIPEPTCPQAFYMTEDGMTLTSLTMHVGETASIPMLVGATGSIYRLSAKTVEGIRVAELTESDMIYATGVGTATFIGMITYTSNGQTIQCEYSLPIIVEQAATQKQSPELSWSETEVYAELGVPVVAPTLSNPHNVPMNKIESQNPSVASISPDGTILTINGVGDAMIFAESYDTDEYYAQSVSYTVHVSTIGLRVKGINVTSANAADVLGDGSYNVTFEVTSRTLHLNSWNIDGANLSFDAMIKDEQVGGEIIPLTIKLHGVNSISNVQTCILAEQVPVVVMGASMRDVLTLSANQIAVNTSYFKIHQCAVSAEAPTAAIVLPHELGVSKNSHLLAESAGVAIQCQTFVKAEGEEGVDILTPGVYFRDHSGFMETATKQPAKLVEIGKVPVVAPADEVTTIDFTATDPEGNESVVFSASTNDTYNEETGQLELATSLTDEAVEQALEDLVPGSSAWIDLLPGSLVFDIPAGQGHVQIQCLTLAGYTLQVKLEGQPVVSISQTEFGWVNVEYNVPQPIHVVIYLHANGGSSAPARIATRMEDAVSAGAYIEAIKIRPSTAPEDTTPIENIEVDSESTGKLLYNGQLYIHRGEQIYTIDGKQVK